MEWMIDPNTHALISPSLARRFRVIPLGEEGGRVKLLIGCRLTEAELREKEALLEFYLGRPVCLQTPEHHPSIEWSFDEILDHYYGNPLPDMMSKPIARHVATVLLLDPVADRRRRHKEQLVTNRLVVVEAASTEEALERLQDPCCEITEVLLPPAPWAGEREARRRLSAVADVRIDWVDKALTQCQCDVTPV